MLTLQHVTSTYDRTPVLHDISLTVPDATTVAVVGPNGAGKTTLARTVSGFTRMLSGRIQLDGEEVAGLNSRHRTLRGIVQVPEGRRLFPQLTVMENLEAAFFARRREIDSVRRAALLQEAFLYFPVLADRREQSAGTLSGGEQQMLSIARALLLEPKVLVLDEPSTGLAPVVRSQIFETLVKRLEATGTSCLLIEQRAHDALRISTYAYVLERGSIAHQGPSTQILNDDELRSTYVGT